jgi:hypothetical protein
MQGESRKTNGARLNRTAQVAGGLTKRIFGIGWIALKITLDTDIGQGNS